MYEYIVTGFVTELRNEIEYFYNQPWTVSKIPDPKDTDPERYCHLSCDTILPGEGVSSIGRARFAKGESGYYHESRDEGTEE